MANEKLTIKQEKFAQNLFAGLSQREAYKQAFDCKRMADKTIDEAASRLHNTSKVTARIKELQDEFKERNMLTVDWVLNKLKTVTERCMTAEPVMIRVGNSVEESGEYTFQAAGANKALELIGRHLGMFIDKVDATNHNLNESLDNMPSAQRQARINELNAKRLSKEVQP